MDASGLATLVAARLLSVAHRWLGRLLAGLQRPRLEVTFRPVFAVGSKLSGSVALVPAGTSIQYPENRFEPPKEWIDSGRFLTECEFHVEIICRDEAMPPGDLRLVELALRVDRMEPLEDPQLRWSQPPFAGGDGDEPVEQVLSPRRTSRLVVFQTPHLPPTTYLMRNFRLPRSPSGGFFMGSGQRHTFPLRFRFREPGDYRVTVVAYFSDGTRELAPVIRVPSLNFHQAASIEELPVDSEFPTVALDELRSARADQDRAIENLLMATLLYGPADGPVVAFEYG